MTDRYCRCGHRVDAHELHFEGRYVCGFVTCPCLDFRGVYTDRPGEDDE